MSFVCGKCGAGGQDTPPVPRRDQYAQRTEIRRADGTHRPYAKTVALLCRKCVDAIVAGQSAPLPEPML